MQCRHLPTCTQKMRMDKYIGRNAEKLNSWFINQAGLIHLNVWQGSMRDWPVIQNSNYSLSIPGHQVPPRIVILSFYDRLASMRER